MTRRVGIILILLLLVSSACIKKVDRPTQIDPLQYFPLNVEDIYIYSGTIRTAVTSGKYDNLFTKTYLDSTGDLVCLEDISVDDHGVYLNSRTYAGDSVPEIHFEPPIPIAPWSNLIGDTLHFATWEVRSDSVNSHLRAQLECEILAVESIVTPAGLFENCIKLRMTYRTIDNIARKFFDGERFYWFAPDIGVVKFNSPVEEGELLQATIGSITYPLN